VAQNRTGNGNRPHTRDDRQPKQERRASARRGFGKRTCNGEVAQFGESSRGHQERRASARRGSVNRTLSGENRALFGDLATDEQQGDRQPAVG
jgi:hypothetical protein